MGIFKNAKIVVSEVSKGVKETHRRISRRKYIESKRQLHIDEPVRGDKELAVFIKENIISKKPEYPDYDSATFESTMAELKREAKKAEENQKKLEEDDVLKSMNIWAEEKKVEEPVVDDISVPDYETLAFCMDILKIKRPESAAVFEATFNRKEALEIIAKKIDEIRDSMNRTDTNKELEKLLTVAPYVDVFRNIKHVYIINGYARSGKDTFIKLFGNSVNKYGQFNTIHSISSVQGIKDIATLYFDYDENRKNDKDRKFLADFKKLSSDYCDFSMRFVLKQVIAADIMGANYVFIHVREPREIKRTKNRIGEIIFPHFSERVTKYDYNGELLIKARKFYDVKTVFIENKRVSGKVTNNSSDTDVEEYKYDYYIDNNGNLEELQCEANRMADRENSEI